jgi:hypothetical protein
MAYTTEMEAVEEAFQSAETFWDWMAAGGATPCESCDQTQVVLLAYIAWKLAELERKTKDKEATP